MALAVTLLAVAGTLVAFWFYPGRQAVGRLLCKWEFHHWRRYITIDWDTDQWYEAWVCRRCGERETE